MLQNHVAPNIGQKLSSNQWPITFGAGLYTTHLYTTHRGELRFTCNIPTFFK